MDTMPYTLYPDHIVATKKRIVKALANLPSREVLLAKLLGCMSNTVASFVRVIDAYRKKLAGEE